MNACYRVLGCFLILVSIQIAGCVSVKDSPIDDSLADVPVGIDAFFPVSTHLGYNVIDREGNVLLDAPFGKVSCAYAHDIPLSLTPGTFSLSPFIGQRSVLLVDERRWVFLDQEGAKAVEPPVKSADSFRRIINLGDSLFSLTNQSKVTGVPGIAADMVFDPTGRWQPSESITPCSLFAESMVPVRKGRLCGFADRKGTVLIDPQFEDCQPFSEGLAAVKSKGLWGFVDKLGRVVIEAKYAKVGRFDIGRAHVLLPNEPRSVFIAADGTQVGEYSPPFETAADEVHIFIDGLCPLQSAPHPSVNDTNYLTYDNTYLLPENMRFASHFSENGLAIVDVDQESLGDAQEAGLHILHRNGELGPKTDRFLGCTPRHGFKFGLAGCYSGYVNEQGRIVWSRVQTR